MHTVGTSWIALVLGKDPANNGQGALLAEPRVTNRGTSDRPSPLSRDHGGEGQAQDEKRSLLRAKKVKRDVPRKTRPSSTGGWPMMRGESGNATKSP